MTTFIVIGVIVLLVAGYLVTDWVLAGRRARRTLQRARDGQVGNANVDYTVIQRQGQSAQQQTWTL
jgi:hypothetical protein